MDVEFLAAGEYHENHLVKHAGSRYVFRINHGTQLGVSRQIDYEFTVLAALERSGVTPRPLFRVGRTAGFPRGALLMEYLSGRTLDYRTDLDSAAECFAAVHAVPSRPPLLEQPHPVLDIVAESQALLNRHPDHPRPSDGARIRRYLARIRALAASPAADFSPDARCIVNTEVNSGNFIVSDRSRLVDWEKAVLSCRYQDLGHFLTPTTTLWKTDIRLPAADRRRFLAHYRDASGVAVSLDEIDERTSIMERTILLRALSWCYMAYAEYGKRPLQNRLTYDRIVWYLDHIHEFLGE